MIEGWTEQITMALNIRRNGLDMILCQKAKLIVKNQFFESGEVKLVGERCDEIKSFKENSRAQSSNLKSYWNYSTVVVWFLKSIFLINVR